MSQIIDLKAKIIVFISFIIAGFVMLNPLMAVASPSLYDFNAAVADENPDARQVAFTDGLSEIFVRLSGDSLIMSKIKRPPSSRFVQQFSYMPIEDPVITEEGVALNHQLNIQYNGKRIKKYLLDNGFSVWSEHRPDVVVWLVVRDGRNEYVLKDADLSLLKTTMDDAMARRGVPKRWPLYDYKDQKNLKVADIRGGFKAPLNNASKRYSRGPVLAGSMIWNGKFWQSSWSLHMATTEQYWSLEDTDYVNLLNTAVNTAADTMGSIFAINNINGSEQLAKIQLEVQAINSIERYRRVENYLKNLSAVDKALPIYIDGKSAVFQISLSSEEQDFLNLINNDAELVEVEIVPEIVPEAVPEAVPETVQQNAESSLTDVSGYKSIIPESATGQSTTGTGEVAIDAVTQLPETQSQEVLSADSGNTEAVPSEPQLAKYYYRLIN